MEMYSYRFSQRRIVGDIPIYNLHGHFHWAGDIGSLAPWDREHKLSQTEDTEDTEERKYKNIQTNTRFAQFSGDFLLVLSMI